MGFMLGGGRRLASESQGLADSKVAEPAAQLGKAVEVEHARTVGRAFPAVPLTAAQVGEVEAALTGDVPAVLRRQWEDRLDDLR